MDSFANCKKCGVPFKVVGNRKFCAKCYSENYEVFQKVREYLYDNPGSTALDIIAAFDGKGLSISHKDILDFLNDERLALYDQPKLKLEPKGKGFHSKR